MIDLSKGQLQSFHSCISNAQKHSVGKVAEALLFFANEIYQSNSFMLPVSRQDLGDMTGTTRESVSRILTDFHNDKLISLDGKKVVIDKPELLKKISEKG
jgi:CRP/FNR family transcriptional regulator